MKALIGGLLPTKPDYRRHRGKDRDRAMLPDSLTEEECPWTAREEDRKMPGTVLPYGPGRYESEADRFEAELVGFLDDRLIILGD